MEVNGYRQLFVPNILQTNKSTEDRKSSVEQLEWELMMTEVFFFFEVVFILN